MKFQTIINPPSTSSHKLIISCVEYFMIITLRGSAGNRLRYLSVLIGDLEEQGQAGEVKVVVQSDQGPVHAALQQDVGVVPQADALHPADHSLVAPHQHVCRYKSHFNLPLKPFRCGSVIELCWFHWPLISCWLCSRRLSSSFLS